MRMIRVRWSLTAGVLSFFAVLWLAAQGSDPINAKEAILVAVVVFLVLSTSFIVNDCVDLAEDCLNEPSKPLPSGAVSEPAARLAATIFALSSFGLILATGNEIQIQLLMLLIISVLYSFIKRISTIASNIVTGICGGILFFSIFRVSGIEMEYIQYLFVAHVVIAIISLETLYDIEDHYGDCIAGKRKSVHRLARLLPHQISISMLSASTFGCFAMFVADSGTGLALFVLTVISVGFIVFQVFRRMGAERLRNRMFTSCVFTTLVVATIIAS